MFFDFHLIPHRYNPSIYMHVVLFLEQHFKILLTSLFFRLNIKYINQIMGYLLKKIFIPGFLYIFFLFLLIFPLESLEASKQGLLLWFDTLLPTLLPFLIVSQLILKTPAIYSIQNLFSPLFTKIFHCSVNGVFCILCGFLCGYPVGARLISLQIKEGRLDIREGQYLLSFCNNVSPMFCISYGILYAIGSNHILPYLLIIYGSALLFALITRPKKSITPVLCAKKQTSSSESVFQLIDVCIIDSFYILIKLCGYMILFSIIQKGCFLLIPSDKIFSPLFACFLEITNGLSLIKNTPIGSFRSASSIAALTFGGLCCIFQTNSVITDTGLSLKKYIIHKILSTCLALCLFFLWNFFCRFITKGWC